MQIPSFVSNITLPPLEYHRMMIDWCQATRASHPVFYDEAHGLWIIMRYEEAVHFDDYTIFSSEHRQAYAHKTESGKKQFTNLISMDPPRHRQMRSLVTQAFSARTIAEMAPQIETITSQLLEPVLPRREMDWMTGLANPLPVMVIAAMLGLSPDEWASYKIWVDEIVNETPQAREAQRNLTVRFEQAIEEHQKQPRQDVLSRLIAAEVDGERLSYEDLMGFCFTLFIAGNITTTNLLGNSLLCFDLHPEAFAALQQNQALLPTAIEEILRYMSPFRSGPNNLIGGRTVMKDTTLGGQSLPQGAQVVVNRVSVNFDEQQFPDPERFDIGRDPNRHQTFGHGIHFCLGAPLARLEAKIALGMLLERMPEAHIIHDQPLQQIESSLFFGPKYLPLAF
jgi:cytochrome P450